MPGPGTKTRTALIPASTGKDRGFATRWKPGQSGNPEGRRVEVRRQQAQELGAVDTINQDTIQLTATLRAKVDPDEMADLLIGLCRAGNLRAIAYVYDRIEGLPVQRHEAKLQYEVDQTAAFLAEKYGLSVQEVQARAKAIAQGS